MRPTETMPFLAELPPVDVFSIDSSTELFAWLEVWHVFAREVDGLAGFRVATGPGRPMVQGETPETAYLDTLTGAERFTHVFNQCFNSNFDVLVGELFVP